MGRWGDIWERVLPQRAVMPTARDRLKQKYDSFRNLLAENNCVLEVINDLEEKREGDYLFDIQYIRDHMRVLEERVPDIIHSLNVIANLKYGQLYGVFDRLSTEIKAHLAGRRHIPEDDLCIPLSAITSERAASVGEKNAHLGEVRNRLGLPVPEGFAVSACAYHAFIEHNRLRADIEAQLGALDVGDLDDLVEVSRRIHDLIMAREVPPRLAEGIEAACAGLRGALAVRSSALGEDSAMMTFAGQYKSALGVGRADVLETYKEIVAGKFTPRAIFYFLSKGFREEELAMSVGFLEMVNARAAGVLYTQDPHDATSNTMIINAAWGLGPYVVDGTVAPDMFRVSKETGEVVESEVAVKELMLAPAEGGVRQETVPEELRRQPALRVEQIARLVEYGLKIEEHFRHPQDIEWALDQEGRLYILQARPLRLVAAGQDTADEKPDLSGCDVLLAQGVCAAPGAGTGPVWVVRQEEDLAAFPDGAVLVARNPSPKFVTVMNRAKAIVCDLGGATGHMATLAREFQVPTLVNAGRATELLKPGEVVTVAASLRMVFRGAVEALTCAREARANILEETPLFAVMDRILDLVVPLNLIDPGDASFKPEGCRTVHDIIRFAHQAALQEMFAVAEDRQLREQGDSVKLDLHIPLVIYVIDLGGGLSPDSPAKVVELPHVLSQPFRAFLAGMTALKWPGPPPLDPRGFASVVVHTMTEARAREEFSTGSFAIVSPLYMNFSLRLGYHLSTIEAYCSPHDNDNYIRFNFRGGGASEDRRGRRARLVETILGHFAFQVICKRDMVDAQLTHEPAAAVLEKLEMLGRLTVHTKQLDMVMFNDAIVDWSIEEFLGKS